MNSIRDIYSERDKKTCRNIYYAWDAAPETATPMFSTTQKTLKVQQADGSVRVAYMYGEKTWSYDQEEVERYREEQATKREEERRRKALLNTIMAQYMNMTTEELMEIVATM